MKVQHSIYMLYTVVSILHMSSINFSTLYERLGVDFANSSDKTSFGCSLAALHICSFVGMSIYMAFFVLMLLFEANMPPASDGVPILGKCFTCSLTALQCSLMSYHLRMEHG